MQLVGGKGVGDVWCKAVEKAESWRSCFPLLCTESLAWCREVKGNEVLFQALEGDGNWKCRGPHRGLLTDSWRKCSSWTSSARTELYSFCWPRRRDSGITEPPGSDLDSVMFSLFCHTSEEPRLYLVCSHLAPNSSEQERQKTEISSHPFHPTSSLPTSFLCAFPFLTLLVLVGHPMVSLPCQTATCF